MRLTLLVRAYCHLCDEMDAALRPLARAHGAKVDVIDVDAPDHAWLEVAWGERIPVLFAGDPAEGELLCELRFDPERVEAVLSGRPAGRG